MFLFSLQLGRIRCFEDTGVINLHKKCNIFIGKNNSGKSTLLKAVYGVQLEPFDAEDVRSGPTNDPAYVSTVFGDFYQTPNYLGINIGQGINVRINGVLSAEAPKFSDEVQWTYNLAGQRLFVGSRPQHQIVPFFARRKAFTFSSNITAGPQNTIDGTLLNLNSRVDLVAVNGHPKSTIFQKTVRQIIGLEIATRATGDGKQSGFYLSDDKFVPIDRMGDGVSELLAHIVELLIEKNKVFVLEEPETNLHPSGLRALLELIRDSSEHNQFIIATHSNIVVRELGDINIGKVFRVCPQDDAVGSPSVVEEVAPVKSARIQVLRELGYEFSDYELHEAWLFLEETTSEQIINSILIPIFAPLLRGKLRTYSAGGVGNVEASLSEFVRLIVFVHLQPVYKNFIWVRVDGDEAGQESVRNIRKRFSDFNGDAVKVFTEQQFEYYYPNIFKNKVLEIFALSNKQEKHLRKVALLKDVLDWTEANPVDALIEWETSAAEPIALLQSIQTALGNSRKV